MTIKPGDKIRFKLSPDGARRNSALLDLTAEYVGTEHCVYSWESRRVHGRGTAASRGEVCMTRSEWDERIEPVPDVPDFFEAGKTYTREVNWSIAAQGEDVTERLYIVRVEYNGDGSPVAFGRLTAKGSYLRVDRWVVEDRYGWGRRWNEAS